MGLRPSRKTVPPCFLNFVQIQQKSLDIIFPVSDHLGDPWCFPVREYGRRFTVSDHLGDPWCALVLSSERALSGSRVMDDALVLRSERALHAPGSPPDFTAAMAHTGFAVFCFFSFLSLASSRLAVIISQAKIRQVLWLSSSFKMFSCTKIATLWASRRFGSLECRPRPRQPKGVAH